MMRNAIILIAVLLIGIMLLGPSFMAGLGDFGESLSDWVKYGWEDQNGDIDTEAEASQGTVSLNAIVQFKDGTQHTVEAEALTFTLFPMTVFFEGKEVERIKWHLGATITWSGDLHGLKISGTLGCWHEETLVDKDDFIKNYEGTVIQKEEWFPIHDLMVTAEEIDLIVPEGTHTLIVTTQELTFTATFDSGHIEENILAEEDAPVWEIQVHIESETMTVLSASIDMSFYPK